MIQHRRRYFAPEAIQSSAMDCGPAALKCLLEGFHISASYGRLREACQTDLDGTSIEAVETAAVQLGLVAEQIMLPTDHLFIREAHALPALVVTQRSDGAMHFVVIWRRHGHWLQIMDPGSGRRWVSKEDFAIDLFRHEMQIAPEEWHAWAATDEFLEPLAGRLRQLGVSPRSRAELITAVRAKPDWRSVAALDASVRMAAALVRSGALRRGSSTLALIRTFAAEAEEEHTRIPLAYWSVWPLDDYGADRSLTPMLIMRGAVLIRVSGRRCSCPGAAGIDSDMPALSPELQAALSEQPALPEREVLRLLPNDGFITPLAMMAAIALAVGGVLLESLLFRGLFDIAHDLGLQGQRVGAIAALIGFMVVLTLLELPIAMQALRLGRQFEIRLRQALLRKLPKLGDRYFHSRPISDMAERAHSVYLTRLVPELGVRFIKAGWDVIFTLLGIVLTAPASVLPAICLALVAVVFPLLAQPLLNERELKVRNHAGALYGFYLDSLLGLVAIRTHGAERTVRREHESRLVEWLRSSRSLIALTLQIQAVQALTCLALAGWLLSDSLQLGGITGNSLLLVYWTLKLPAAGKQLSGLAQQYPSERNALLRLLEPLQAPEETEATDRTVSHGHEPAETPTIPRSDVGQGAAEHSRDTQGMALRIRAGTVVAAGQTILRDVDLALSPGEHVAVVGPSGAGKSSLLGLLLGWHRLQSGSLEVDGEPMVSERLAGIRQATAWIDPSLQLWNRSLLENLQYSSEAPAGHDIARLLEAATLHAVVQKLPHGLQTRLGECGGLISGGEGQRVRMGRALHQTGVRLVLLDEPFRGLDKSQRSSLLTRARSWWRSSTVLCVTHDVGETLGFDRVLVIENGKIVEDDTPERLASSATRYRELLHAERTVQREIWEAACWRRLRMEDGRLVDDQARIVLDRHTGQPSGKTRQANDILHDSVQRDMQDSLRVAGAVQSRSIA